MFIENLGRVTQKYYITRLYRNRVMHNIPLDTWIPPELHLDLSKVLD